MNVRKAYLNDKKERKDGNNPSCDASQQGTTGAEINNVYV